MNAKSAAEVSLSRRVAGLLSSSWTRVPLPGVDAPTPGSETAANLAKAHFIPVLESLQEMPPGGWGDVRLWTALMILGSFGDAYAIASYEGSATDIPARALPSIELTSEAAVASGVVDWSREAGNGIPVRGYSGAVRGHAVHPSEPSAERTALFAATFGYDIWSSDAGEQPSWEGFQSASDDARERLRSTIVGYTSTLGGLDHADDAHALATFREQTRPLITRGIAFARRDFSTRVSKGAEREAIFATALTLTLLRCIFVVTAVTGRRDADASHLLSLDRVQSLVRTFEIETWLERQAPEQG